MAYYNGKKIINKIIMHGEAGGAGGIDGVELIDNKVYVKDLGYVHDYEGVVIEGDIPNVYINANDATVDLSSATGEIEIVDDKTKNHIFNVQNLTAENIAKDVEILGVKGTFEGGGSDTLAEFFNNEQSELNNSNITKLPNYAFYSNKFLTKVDLSNCESVGSYAFYANSNLKNANFLNVTRIGDSAFYLCDSLKSANFLNATSIGGGAFSVCKILESVNFPNAKSIGSQAFSGCYLLKAVIIRQTDTICTLANSNAFTNCYHILGTTNATYNPNGDKDGYIYVPKNMVDTLKISTNWSVYADQIRALEDYTVDGTTTGELDESKI